MKRTQFNYSYLPSHVAQKPVQKRDDSRLLFFSKNQSITDHTFSELPEILNQQFSLKEKNKKLLLIGNNSKVYPARLQVFRATGAKCELFILEVGEKNHYSCLLKPKAKLKENEILYLNKNQKDPVFQLIDLKNSKVKPLFSESMVEFLETHGATPLPPYIKDLRPDDKIRYQNVYANGNHTGSSAAPTAGFHFTDELIGQLSKYNIEIDYVTLHVGLGTFLPVKTENISEHTMHEEQYYMSEGLIKKIFEYRKHNWPIVFIGTTSLRSIESFFRKLSEINSNLDFASALKLSNQWHSTKLFLYPRHETDRELPLIGNALITNFHQPESSLLMLVASIIGFENLKKIYDHAIHNQYRLFSYGDSSLLIF